MSSFLKSATPDRKGDASNILRLKSGGGEAKKWVGLVNRGQLVADRGAVTPITACSLPLPIPSFLVMSNIL